MRGDGAGESGAKITTHTKTNLKANEGLKDFAHLCTCVYVSIDGGLGKKEAEKAYLFSYSLAFMNNKFFCKLMLLPHSFISCFSFLTLHREVV